MSKAQPPTGRALRHVRPEDIPDAVAPDIDIHRYQQTQNRDRRVPEFVRYRFGEGIYQ